MAENLISFLPILFLLNFSIVFNTFTKIYNMRSTNTLVHTLLLTINLCSCSRISQVSVQTETKKHDTLQEIPTWIQMMNDPKVNYYQAVEAFNAYWSKHEKPTEDSGEARDIYGKEKSEAEKKAEASRSVQYVYEYKQFLNWMERNKNLVKTDGTLMTPAEILEQSEKERKNRQ